MRHVVLYVRRIARDNRAVVVVDRSRELIPLIRDARIEDELESMLNEPGHMSVGKLRRIALRFTRDRFDAELVGLVSGCGSEDHLVAELSKEGEP